MKNVFLSVVIICALTIAGVGGTLANFSDTEEITDNVFESGSLDLLVYDGANYVQQAPYGPGVSGVIDITCAAPEDKNWAKIWVANFGDCVDGDLYLAFKNFRCYNVLPSHPESRWLAYDDRYTPNYKWKTEPEMVAEYGGYIEQYPYFPETGTVEGDNCSWEKILEVKVKFDGVMVQNWIFLDELVNIPPEYIYLGELESCGVQHYVDIGLRFPDIEDEAWEARGLNELFKDWPTNRYMLDGALFDILFGLVSDTDG